MARVDAVIREATAADAECLAALAIQVWLHTYATDGIRGPIAHYVLSEFTPQNFARIASDCASRMFVAERDGHLVGYALIRFDAACPTDKNLDVELVTLYVQEHSKRQGCGAALLDHCRLAVSRRRGHEHLWLTVNAGNAPAIAFYEKQGLRPAGTALFRFAGGAHENRVFITTGKRCGSADE